MTAFPRELTQHMELALAPIGMGTKAKCVWNGFWNLYLNVSYLLIRTWKQIALFDWCGLVSFCSVKQFLVLLIRNSTKASELPLVGNLTVNGCIPTPLLCCDGGTWSSPSWSKHWDSSWWEGGRLALLRGAPSSCLCSMSCWEHMGGLVWGILAHLSCSEASTHHVLHKDPRCWLRCAYAEGLTWWRNSPWWGNWIWMSKSACQSW